MFRNLLRFEWYYHTHRPLFYITIIAFTVIGFLTGYAGGISFPNVHINSPYHISFLTGLLSLAAIFAITLSVAQTFLRESETKFDAIIYATPVSKFTYMFSRLGSIAGIAILSFTMAIIGMYSGHVFSLQPEENKGAWSLLNYAWPLLVLALPNIILCVSVLCGTAWLTRSKLIVYVAGLLIYVLYIVGSIFANSPLIAGATPASPEAMALFAKLDPLGMAAFFEQTRYWTALERNTQQLSLNENFLFNRILWLLVSVMIVSLSYLRFSFRKLNTNAPRKIKPAIATTKERHTYNTVETVVHTRKHNIASLLSFFKIDAVSIFKGIPFILIMILWTTLLGIEISNAVKGDPRLGESYATTGIIITSILETIPFFSLLVILFYSNELIWRSKSVNFYAVESTTPVNPLVVFLSRLLSLSIIPFFLVVFSCVIGIVLQLVKGFPVIRFDLYASLFYYLGLPLLLCVVLITGIQTVIKNKYAGLTVATLIILLTSTSLGRMIGIRHPLMRYANTFSTSFSDMNGFGSYVTAFHWQMLYWSALAVCIVIISSFLWNRNAAKFGRWQKALLISGALVFLASGSYIFYQTNIKHPYLTEDEVNDWKQSYETKFKPYEGMAKPAITHVKTTIDLYPRQNRYDVRGQYRLVNNTTKGIDSMLIYIDREIKLKSISIANAKQVANESGFGHYWYVMDNKLQPGESISMQFSFSFAWSPFKGHTAFNSIIENGSFMRISNYFPSIGYEGGNELTSKIERKKRLMAPQAELKALEAGTATSYDYGFINLHAIVSTEGDQIAIGSGELKRQWKQHGRNYSHYISDRPMPFRFAFSSARYAVKKDVYKNIPIEVYYDKRHAVNVDSLISNAKTTLAYCEQNFGNYPHKVIRFAEVSAFAEGFAATAYPGVIYMKENGGFYNNLGKGNQEDIINQLAGHELSHQWWGSAQLAPEYREGGWILTETLAKYTELMLYKRAHGHEAVLEIIKEHIDLYLSNRSFSREMPLYRTSYETPHLPYNKGTVIMHQLHQLIGEEAVNTALKSFLANHAYPKAPPTSQDLLNEIYKASPSHLHSAIDELFKQIIIYDSKVEEVQCAQSGNEYEVSFKVVTHKHAEDGYGKHIKVLQDSVIEIGIYTEDKRLQVQKFKIINNRVEGKIRVNKRPVKIVVDPYLKTMDSFLKDNEKMCY